MIGAALCEQYAVFKYLFKKNKLSIDFVVINKDSKNDKLGIKDEKLDNTKNNAKKEKHMQELKLISK